MNPDPPQALEPFRSYLDVLARIHLDPRLRGKLDPADVVQQTFLRAYAAWPELHNPDRPVLLAWLRRILARTLADVVKHSQAAQRNEELLRLADALTALPEPQSEVVSGSPGPRSSYALPHAAPSARPPPPGPAPTVRGNLLPSSPARPRSKC
jgi:DNA-directed RNA polymerase specialized sigma24 family protein